MIEEIYQRLIVDSNTLEWLSTPSYHLILGIRIEELAEMGLVKKEVIGTFIDNREPIIAYPLGEIKGSFKPDYIYGLSMAYNF